MAGTAWTRPELDGAGGRVRQDMYSASDAIHAGRFAISGGGRTPKVDENGNWRSSHPSYTWHAPDIIGRNQRSAPPQRQLRLPAPRWRAWLDSEPPLRTDIAPLPFCPGRACSEMVEFRAHAPPAIVVPPSPDLADRQPQLDVEVRKVLRHGGAGEDGAYDGAVSPRTVSDAQPPPAKQSAASASAPEATSRWPDLVDIAVAWSAEMQALLGYPGEDIVTTVEWWFERIHPDDIERVAEGLRAHFAYSESASIAVARLWYCEYRMLRHTHDERLPSYLLIGERMSTTRRHGLPVLSESFTFDLERRRTGHRHSEDLKDESTFRIVTENMHSGLFM